MLDTHRDLQAFFMRENKRDGNHKGGLEDPVPVLVRKIYKKKDSNPSAVRVHKRR